MASEPHQMMTERGGQLDHTLFWPVSNRNPKRQLKLVGDRRSKGRFMPRYFQNLVSLHDFAHDLDGAQFEDIREAISDALQAIRDMAAEDLRFLQPFELVSIRICDEDSLQLTEVFAADALNEVVRSVVVIPQDYRHLE